jgi:hypothetical protein
MEPADSLAAGPRENIRIFFLATTARGNLRFSQVIVLYMRICCLYKVVQLQVHANGHLLPSNAEFRNTYAYVYKLFFKIGT